MRTKLTSFFNKNKSSLQNILVILWLSSIITLNLVMANNATEKLMDFGSFIAAGIKLKEGENPYNAFSPLIFNIYFPNMKVGGQMPNLNPPITLLAFRPLADFDNQVSANIWRLASLGIYVLAIFLLAWMYKKTSVYRFIWAFTLAGFWHTLELGQIYIPLLLLVILVWIYSENKKDIVAGVFLGLLISIKPNFLIWLIFIFTSKNWKMTVAAISTLLITSLIPLIAFGPNVYLQWFEATKVGSNVLGMPGNSSLLGFTSRLGDSKIGLFIVLGLLAVFAIFMWQKSHLVLEKNCQLPNELGVILSLLASPISWVGYTIFLVPLFFSRKHWTPFLLISATILSFPFIFPLLLFDTTQVNFVFWGGFYSWALLLLLPEYFGAVFRISQDFPLSATKTL